ncbi:hypothetical protein PENTCL1PPCAC_30225, partial [Pristionchus entomophagus]
SNLFQMPEAQKSSTTVETNEKDVISKNPNLELAQSRFLLSHPEVPKEKKEEIWQALFKEIKENDMAPLYKSVCEDLQIPIDSTLHESMKSRNTKKIEEFEAEIEDAEQNLGESEVRQAWLKKSEYLCQIGDKEGSIVALEKTYHKTV